MEQAHPFLHKTPSTHRFFLPSDMVPFFSHLPGTQKIFSLCAQEKGPLLLSEHKAFSFHEVYALLTPAVY